MNDLIPQGLRHFTFVMTATIAGWALHALGVAHEFAEVLHHFSPGLGEQAAIFLIPLMGVGAAELLGTQFVQKLFWHALPSTWRKLLQGGCPDLNGIWDVTWRSNDPINKALYEAYAGSAHARTPLDSIPFADHTGKIEIEATPAAIVVRLHRAAVTDANASTVARLFREVNGEVVLTYQSRPAVHSPSARDSDSYNFAARLTFDSVSGRLSGHYSTDRGMTKGQNSAGYLMATRAVSSPR